MKRIWEESDIVPGLYIHPPGDEHGRVPIDRMFLLGKLDKEVGCCLYYLVRLVDGNITATGKTTSELLQFLTENNYEVASPQAWMSFLRAG